MPSPRSPNVEEPLPTLPGRAWAFGLRLTAIDLLPARYARAELATARRRLFADLDPTLAERLAVDDVLVADAFDGTADAVRPALAAIAAAGVTSLVARAFAPVVAREAFAHGVLAVVVDAPAFIHTGDRLRLDFGAGKIVNLSSGDRAAIRNLDDATHAAIRTICDRRRPND